MILIDANRKNEGKNKCWLVYSTSFMGRIRLLRQQGKWREEKSIRNLVIKVRRIYSVPSHSLHVRMSSRVICSALYLTEKKSFIIGSDFSMIYSWQRHLSSNNKKNNLRISKTIANNRRWQLFEASDPACRSLSLCQISSWHQREMGITALEPARSNATRVAQLHLYAKTIGLSKNRMAEDILTRR